MKSRWMTFTVDGRCDMRAHQVSTEAAALEMFDAARSDTGCARAWVRRYDYPDHGGVEIAQWQRALPKRGAAA